MPEKIRPNLYNSLSGNHSRSHAHSRSSANQQLQRYEGRGTDRYSTRHSRSSGLAPDARGPPRMTPSGMTPRSSAARESFRAHETRGSGVGTMDNSRAVGSWHGARASYLDGSSHGNATMGASQATGAAGTTIAARPGHAHIHGVRIERGRVVSCACRCRTPERHEQAFVPLMVLSDNRGQERTWESCMDEVLEMSGQTEIDRDTYVSLLSEILCSYHSRIMMERERMYDEVVAGGGQLYLHPGVEWQGGQENRGGGFIGERGVAKPDEKFKDCRWGY